MIRLEKRGQITFVSVKPSALRPNTTNADVIATRLQKHVIMNWPIYQVKF